jgi:hypothetical protein
MTSKSSGLTLRLKAHHLAHQTATGIFGRDHAVVKDLNLASIAVSLATPRISA